MPESRHLRYLLALLALTVATPAPAQIRFFQDGSVVVIGPTKEELHRRHAGMMMGVISNKRPAAGNSLTPLPPSAIPVAGQQPQSTAADGH